MNWFVIANFGNNYIEYYPFTRYDEAYKLYQEYKSSPRVCEVYLTENKFKEGNNG